MTGIGRLPIHVLAMGLVLFPGVGPAAEKTESTRAEAPPVPVPSLMVLGEPPLCEPSAAIPAPWDPSLVLVADDEVEDSLFAFTVEDGLLRRQRRLRLPAGLGPSDIEALAATDDGLLVVGSHSRNKRCEIKPSRRRLLIVRWDRAESRLAAVRVIDSARIWGAAASSIEGCLATLFTDPAPALAREVCAAIVDAEREARPGSPACRTINIEGAVAVPGPVRGSPTRVWLGLRDPLAGGAAILLRLIPSFETLRFDGAALVDLGGRGVRELALREATLWGIAGPEQDGGGGSFQIWRTPLSSLAPGGRLAPEWMEPVLPDSSEGIVFEGAGGIAVIDGDRGAKGARTCGVPGRQTRIPLP